MNAVQDKRLTSLLNHINFVRSGCEYVGRQLIDDGQIDLGRQLIANGYIHDQSKFHGIEWDYLHADIRESRPDLFKMAARQHVNNNGHHPEFHGGIEFMPPVYLLELAVDWWARGIEFNNPIEHYLDEVAVERFNISEAVYGQITEYMGLLPKGHHEFPRVL